MIQNIRDIGGRANQGHKKGALSASVIQQAPESLVGLSGMEQGDDRYSIGMLGIK